VNAETCWRHGVALPPSTQRNYTTRVYLNLQAGVAVVDPGINITPPTRMSLSSLACAVVGDMQHVQIPFRNSFKEVGRD